MTDFKVGDEIEIVSMEGSTTGSASVKIGDRGVITTMSRRTCNVDMEDGDNWDLSQIDLKLKDGKRPKAKHVVVWDKSGRDPAEVFYDTPSMRKKVKEALNHKHKYIKLSDLEAKLEEFENNSIDTLKVPHNNCGCEYCDFILWFKRDWKKFREELECGKGRA